MQTTETTPLGFNQWNDNESIKHEMFTADNALSDELFGRTLLTPETAALFEVISQTPGANEVLQAVAALLANKAKITPWQRINTNANVEPTLYWRYVDDLIVITGALKLLVDLPITHMTIASGFPQGYSASHLLRVGTVTSGRVFDVVLTMTAGVLRLTNTIGQPVIPASAEALWAPTVWFGPTITTP